MIPSRNILLFLALLLSCGCFEEDYFEVVDAKVTKEWMRPGMYTDAIEYFENGGNYFITDDSQGLDLDRQGIVPFLKELKKEFGTEQYAILLEEEDYAWGVVMKMPQVSNAQERVADFVEESQAAFPGMIITEWGYDWVSFDFLDEAGADVVRRARERSAK
jgi:hypothetical protein